MAKVNTVSAPAVAVKRLLATPYISAVPPEVNAGKLVVVADSP